jgi:hypothetical protein
MDKDIKHISFYIPNNLNELKPDVEFIINECNKIIIKKVLENNIYTSKISDSDKEKINLLFNKNKKLILDTF